MPRMIGFGLSAAAQAGRHKHSGAHPSLVGTRVVTGAGGSRSLESGRRQNRSCQLPTWLEFEYRLDLRRSEKAKSQIPRMALLSTRMRNDRFDLVSLRIWRPGEQAVKTPVIREPEISDLIGRSRNDHCPSCLVTVTVRLASAGWVQLPSRFFEQISLLFLPLIIAATTGGRISDGLTFDEPGRNALK